MAKARLQGTSIALLLLFLAATPSTAAIPGGTSGSFSVASNGSAVYQIRIAVPPGTQGVAPSLSLVYNHQLGDGMLGVGWALTDLPAIVRCGASILQDGFRGGVHYDGDDRFCLEGSEDGRLVPVDPAQTVYSVPGAVYRTEKDDWSRVIASRDQCGSGPCSFQVQLKSGAVMGLGTRPGGRLPAISATTRSPLPPGSIRKWLLTDMTDLDGNTLRVDYTQTPPRLGGGRIAGRGREYPERIDYTLREEAPAMAPMRSVQFFYVDRDDAAPDFEGGAVVDNAALLRTIRTCIASDARNPVTGRACGDAGLMPVRQYNLDYQQNPLTGQRRLASIQECDGAGQCLSPTVATWSDGPDRLVAAPGSASGISNNDGFVADFDGNGMTDLLSFHVTGKCPGAAAILYFSKGRGFDDGHCVNLPLGRYSKRLPGDFNGDGRLDLLLAGNSAGAIFFSRGEGVFDKEGTEVRIRLDSQVFPADVNGDGLTDVVTATSSRGALYLSNGKRFGPAIPIDRVSLGQGQTWLVDFSGDGRADLFAAGPSRGTLYLSHGDGFDPGIDVTGLNLRSGATFVSDFNGDGLPDLFSATASRGFVSHANGRGFEPPVPTDLQLGQDLYIADMNGDGLTDLYAAGSAASRIYYSTKKGFVRRDAPGENLLPNATWLGDFNGDGAADLFAPSTSGGIDTFFFAAPAAAEGAGAGPPPNAIVAMTNGIGGQTRIVYRPLTDGTVYARQDDTSAEGAFETLRALNTFAYVPVSRVQVPLYANAIVQNPLHVVASYTLANDPAANAAAYSYQYDFFYTRLLYNLLGRGSLGFSSVTKTDRTLASQQTLSMRQDFPFNGEMAAASTCPAATPVAPCGAAPLTTTTREYICQDTRTGASCRTANTAYDPTATRIFQVLPFRGRFQDAAYGSVLENEVAYDRFANQTRIIERGDTKNGPHPVYTCQEFSNDTERWRIGYLTGRKISASPDCTDMQTFRAAAGDLRLARLRYDGRMHVAAELHWDDQNAIWVGTAYQYDAYGNETADTQMAGAPPAEIAGSTFSTVFETAYNTFPASRATPAPAPGDPKSAPLVTTFAYDARFGTRIATRDPNGNIENICVDSLGRDAIRQAPPPAGSPAEPNCIGRALYPYVAAAFLDNTATSTVENVVFAQEHGLLSRQTQKRTAWGSPAGWQPATAYFDGLGRTYRMTTSNDGRPLNVDQQFRTETLIGMISLPYPERSERRFIRSEYDLVGRLQRRTTPYQAPDGTVSESVVDWTYTAPNTMTETRRAGTGRDYVVRTRFEYFDTQQQPVSVSLAGDGGTSTFDYDLLGSLVAARSPKGAGAAGGVVNTARFDSLGRRIAHEESDSGLVREAYNALGEIDHRIDALGQRTDYSYDALLRPTGTRILDAQGRLALSYRFQYDAAPAPGPFGNLRGALAAVTVSDDKGPYLTYAYGYDARSNETARRVTFPGFGEPLLFTGELDPQRRQVSAAFPDAARSVVTWTYEPASGNLVRVSYASAARKTAEPYVEYSRYTTGYQPGTIRFHNGATEQWDYDVAGRPHTRTIRDASQSLLAGSAFQWDPFGNLTATVDCNFRGNAGNPQCIAAGAKGTATADLSQSFVYENNRLMRATGPFGNDDARRTLEFAYDAAGNLTANDGVVYSYAGHRAVAGRAGTRPVYQAFYDANGAMCFKALGSTPLQACPAAPAPPPPGVTSFDYRYGADGLLNAVRKNGVLTEAYRYDDEGRRVVKSEYAPDGVTAAATTYYFDPSYEVTVTGSGASDALYLTGVSGRFAVLERSLKGGAAAPAVSFLHQDLVGSTVVVTGPAGKLESRVTYLPYGVARSSAPDGAPKTTLFNGKELDATGLYYFDARYQDPVLGRFISADDLTAGSTFARDALNRYAFTLNNPVVFADPSGNTPLFILAIVFQAIFDVLTEGAETPELAAIIAAGIGRRFGAEVATAELETVAARLLANSTRRVTAGELASSAATALRESGVLSAERIAGGKLTVAITGERYIVADVSGAVRQGDNLTEDLLSEQRLEAYESVKAEAKDAGRYTKGGREPSFKDWGIRNCSEFRACNRIELSGERLEDVEEFHTVNLKDSLAAPRCANCRRSTRALRRRAVTSDPQRSMNRNAKRLRQRARQQAAPGQAAQPPPPPPGNGQ